MGAASPTLLEALLASGMGGGACAPPHDVVAGDGRAGHGNDGGCQRSAQRPRRYGTVHGGLNGVSGGTQVLHEARAARPPRQLRRLACARAPIS